MSTKIVLWLVAWVILQHSATAQPLFDHIRSLEVIVDHAEVALIGKCIGVAEVQEKSPTRTITFRVEESLRGEISSKVEVQLRSDSVQYPTQIDDSTTLLGNTFLVFVDQDRRSTEEPDDMTTAIRLSEPPTKSDDYFTGCVTQDFQALEQPTEILDFAKRLLNDQERKHNPRTARVRIPNDQYNRLPKSLNKYRLTGGGIELVVAKEAVPHASTGDTECEPSHAGP
jgi:hypothetical protein